MPAPKVISRDDAQISSRHPRKHRQRTASPPLEIGKRENACEKQIDSSSHKHSSPFRSLPNAKKTLIALMKWSPSMSPSSSTKETNQGTESQSSGRDKSNQRNADIRPVDSNDATPQKQRQVQSERSSNHGRKSDVNYRIQECVKDLNVSLRFLDDVVRKDKLVMLDGSASIVLDTVLKLLLILNEKRRRHCNQENESQDVLDAYNSVYYQLATLLKFADQLVIKNQTASTSERQTTLQLSQALKDAVQTLLTVATASEADTDQIQRHKPNESKPRANGRDRLRKSSLASSSSASSSAPDWAAEDEGDSRVQHLDKSFATTNQTQNRRWTSDQKPMHQDQSTPNVESPQSASRPASSVSSSSSGSGILTLSKQMKFPSNLRSNGQRGCPTISAAGDSSNGSLSPPSADSGVFSLSDTSGFSACDDSSLSNSSLATVPASMITSNIEEFEDTNGTSLLDDILAKLKLNGLSTTTMQEKICNQQHTADGDVETVTQEEEEMVGDTKIIRKKIITRQKVRHQSVLTTTTTTHVPLIDSSESDLLNLLSSPPNEPKRNNVPWKRRISQGDEVNELRLVENERCKLAGGASNQSSKPNTKKAAGAAVTFTGMPSSSYDKEADNQRRDAKLLSTKQKEQLMQHSSSVQSFSRQTLVNGRLVVNENAQKVDISAMKASKSETFDGDGRITERRGAGSYAESSYAVGDRNFNSRDQSYGQKEEELATVQRRVPGTKGLPPPPPPRPSKRSVVSSYVQLFGSGTPSNQADFRSSTLATYVQLRDRWNDHFEAHKRKAMTYQFVSTPASSSGVSTNGRSNDSTSSTSSSSSPKTFVNRISRSRREIEEDGEEGAPVWVPRKPHEDIQNLDNILNVNDYLKFPKQPAVEAPAEKKRLPFCATLALTGVNLLDEIDVKQHLICKKSATDDGPEIRGGPLDALIVHATKTSSDGFAAGSNAPNAHGHGFCYQEAFLTTYRTFCRPLDLIRKLIYRYNLFNANAEDSTKKKAAKNTFSLLVRVVDDLSAVEMSDDLVRLLSDFIHRMILEGELNFPRLLRQKLMERFKMKRLRSLDETSPLYRPRSGNAEKSQTLLDFKASTLAEQLTFLDWYSFQKIELSEMLLWAQEQSEENSPNLTIFTEHFNKMSYWVRTRILERTDQKEREQIFGKFVKIMRHLRRLNNFNSCLALLSALDSGPIRRLEWPKASVESLNEHSSLIDSSQSFKTYRMALADAKPPCLPYIGLILQDLTFVHVGNPNCLPTEQCQNRSDILNFAKRWQQYTILDNMRRFKAWPYGVKKNEDVLALFDDFNDYISEDSMWEISERLKPRQQTNFVGVARRVQVNPS